MTAPWGQPGFAAEAVARKRRDRRWLIFGIVLITGIALAGLAVVAAAILFVIALGSYGSNK